MKNGLRIIVLGYLVRGPLAGMAWHHLQYLMGLTGLGHDVYLLEDSDDYLSCYNPQRHVTDTEPSYGLAFAIPLRVLLAAHPLLLSPVLQITHRAISTLVITKALAHLCFPTRAPPRALNLFETF